jgi:hypothetical protein
MRTRLGKALEPPDIHAILSARVTACAWKPWVGSAPQAGALLEYIADGGAGSTSREFGSRGAIRKRIASGGSVARVRRDLATALHEVAASEGGARVHVGGHRPVLLVGESRRAARCRLSVCGPRGARRAQCRRGPREGDVGATGIWKREGIRSGCVDWLGHGCGRCGGTVVAGTGRVVLCRGAGKAPCEDTAHIPGSFNTMR